MSDPRPGLIKEIEEKFSSLIAAGQKICDIESVVRELVENSIDASARCIEVRLTKFGVEAIEVEDDGSGIDPENFQKLARRHHTSKIQDFENLQESLETYGFRGEALNCLSTISNLTIITRCSNSPTGTKLVFKDDGKIAKMEKVARSRGTTVIIKDLFKTFPVRKVELRATAKKKYDRIAKCLYEQKLARPHIRFTLCKKNDLKKEKDFAFSNLTLEGSIIEIFGEKVLHSLIPIKQNLTDFLDFSTIPLNRVKDRSYIEEINNKAEDIKESDSYIDSKTDQDRGLPPTKKFKSDESEINEKFESACEPNREFFVFARNSKFKQKKPTYTFYGYISKIGQGRPSQDGQYIFVNKKPCDIPKISRAINETYKTYSPQLPFFCLFISVESWAADFNVPKKRAVILQQENQLCDMIRTSLNEMFSALAPTMQKSCPVTQIPIAIHQGSQSYNLNECLKRKSDVTDTDKDENIVEIIQQDTIYPSDSLELNLNSSIMQNSEPSKISSMPLDIVDSTLTQSMHCSDKQVDSSIEKSYSNVSSRDDKVVSNETSGSNIVNNLTIAQDTHQSSSPEINTDGIRKSGLDLQTEDQRPIRDGSPSFNDEMMESRFSFIVNKVDNETTILIENVEDLIISIQIDRKQKEIANDGSEFIYSIHPKFNPVAEQELKMKLDKSSFSEMEIVGQFNYGFIITRQNSHIFVIDQHASDERTNYENELTVSPIVKQPMVHPKPLYLNIFQENLIIENLKLFESKGFGFLIDSSKDPGFRVMLNCTSTCKGYGIDEHLNKDDIEELIAVVNDIPANTPGYILKKVRNFSATRACRKSVMIGDRLNFCQMKNIVSKMAELKNPWCCAHGRPTIRHLMDIDWMSNNKSK